MVTSEPVEGECTKTRAEQRYGTLINQMKLKDQSRLGKLDVQNEILRIMKLKPTLDMEIERNAEDLYWFVEHNNSMMPRNEQGFPRFLRWIISDINNTIEKDINEAMKKLVSFIEEKSKKLYEADARNVQDDKDLVDLFVDSLQEIISFNKELKSDDERDDDEKKEEEGEKGEKSGKVDDVDDSDDIDDDEEGEKGKISGKAGDLDGSYKE
ncbi:uncharacterized protein LOC113340112 [Papaver somniferum]|uniref:uncharacterized protein LOC113340112 n=1 Tax=Papaver somniferum TaxID=3469 RepID=UPI000E6FDFCE|nr:uncharacterized protein LOC113340112 [Papaver somniferum]